MQDVRFDTPIAVQSASASAPTLLRTVQEASDFLLSQWPGKKSEKYRAALQACHDAVAGDKPAMTARRAFLAAGRETGVLVKDSALG